MLKKNLIVMVSALLASFPLVAQKTAYEKSGKTETATYQEVIAWYKSLAAEHSQVKLMEMGETDSGKPLHLVLFSTEGEFNVSELKEKGYITMLVNNGIHPGEPDGIDASMMLIRDLLKDKRKQKELDKVLLGIIPLYNIGGALNRMEHTRVNQNGPVAKGFRGNARNLDLNRDFIKADSKNARTFAKIFQYLDPELFLDNHVSNGADYQHVMTLLTTQHNKLGGNLGSYLQSQLEPSLYAYMEKAGFPMVPYVNVWGTTPEKGWNQFYDSPRYSSGYATLFQSIGFTAETHMLKPYHSRVEATYALMESMLQAAAKDRELILSHREKDREMVRKQEEFPLNWEHDTTAYRQITLKGYEWEMQESEVSGLQRLYYDRQKPFTAKVPFYDTYRPKDVVEKPQAYIIPPGWYEVAELLKINEVEMTQLDQDSTIEVELYHIAHYKTMQRPYENHYSHYDTQVEKTVKRLSIPAGSWIVPTGTDTDRYVVEVLEPAGRDSFFNWNYFDAILQQKEGFSAYVFEDLAARYLAEDPGLRKALQQKQQEDEAFAQNPYAQLQFIFERTPYFEKAYLRYPIYRVN
ncbi:M14 family metallopeptidase [Roseivirga sp. BDSF3-8]|uniref:M14 family metallopeptidase n=1 Tax=Roseivirga sp. BDSF3-8 TaxID=3241598 RepID=UPI003531E383